MSTSLEDQLRHDLRAAVGGVDAPHGFADGVLADGRRRRRRRTTLVVAAGACAAVAGALLVVPGLGADPDRDLLTDQPGRPPVSAIAWARDLPQGEAPALPFFDGTALRDGDERVDVPADVDQTEAPVRVAGGWVVALDAPYDLVAPAVLTAGGDLRPLPTYDASAGRAGTDVVASPDGEQVAYGGSVVEVATGEATPLPHDPQVDEPGGTGFVTVLGWTGEGLVYQGSPTVDGIGSEWLLGPDGATTRLSGPSWQGVPRSQGRGAAGTALVHEPRGEGRCTTAYALAGGEWEESGSGCTDRPAGQDLDVSPDGRWLATDALPLVWDLEEGRFATLDAPAGVLAELRDTWSTTLGWESDDTLLLPVTDVPTPLDLRPGRTVEQAVQLVRCSMETLSCERAGEELDVTLTGDRATGLASPRIAFSTS